MARTIVRDGDLYHTDPNTEALLRAAVKYDQGHPPQAARMQDLVFAHAVESGRIHPGPSREPEAPIRAFPSASRDGRSLNGTRESLPTIHPNDFHTGDLLAVPAQDGTPDYRVARVTDVSRVDYTHSAVPGTKDFVTVDFVDKRFVPQELGNERKAESVRLDPAKWDARDTRLAPSEVRELAAPSQDRKAPGPEISR